MIAVSDTGPLLYLSLIEQIHLLPRMFERILIPGAVADELSHSSAPHRAFAMIENRPDWLQVHAVASMDSALGGLGTGERESIALAVSSGADFLLIDDRAARDIATQAMGVVASGTIGILYEAARNDAIPFSAAEFDQSIERLLATNFYSSNSLRKAIERLSENLHGR